MSLTSPLLKDLKASFYNIMNEPVITDTSQELPYYCMMIERIFYAGLCPKDFGVEPHCWPWLRAIAIAMEKGTLPKTYSYVTSYHVVENDEKCHTPLGKFRLLIRTCLVNKCLHVPVEILVRHLQEHKSYWYQLSADSILGHDVFGEIFLSVLLQTSQLHFNLILTNARFLDRTWLLPEMISTEFVPCKYLGLVVSFVADFAVIVSIDKGSVAAEDGLLEIGDVLDEINGQVLTEKVRGRVKRMLAKNEPVKVTIIKTFCAYPEKTYCQMAQLLSNEQHLIHILKTSNPRYHQKSINLDEARTGRSLPKVIYKGSCDMQRKGDLASIECGIETKLLKRTDSETSQYTEVIVDCRELEIVLISVATGDTLMRLPYVKIASCGQSRKSPHHFAFMLGNDTCMLATSFSCHVFYAKSETEACEVVCNIGHGLERTKYAV